MKEICISWAVRQVAFFFKISYLWTDFDIFFYICGSNIMSCRCDLEYKSYVQKWKKNCIHHFVPPQPSRHPVNHCTLSITSCRVSAGQLVLSHIFHRGHHRRMMSWGIKSWHHRWGVGSRRCISDGLRGKVWMRNNVTYMTGSEARRITWALKQRDKLPFADSDSRLRWWQTSSICERGGRNDWM